jgi:sulfotransferase family protein
VSTDKRNEDIVAISEDLSTEGYPITDREFKVLFIAGEGRSGSTIIGDILGQIEGFFSVGELFYVWDRGLIQNWRCSCSLSFEECPVWSEVIAQAFGDRSQVDAEKLLSMREQLHTRHLLPMPARRGPQERLALMGEYREALGRLYHAVQSVTGSKVVVDGSGFPAQAYILQTIPSIELYILHLIRDSRAVVYSSTARKKKVVADLEGTYDHYMGSDSILMSSLLWDMYSSVIERKWGNNSERYAVMRYEDFVKAPKAAIEGCLRFLSEERSELPFVSEREVMLSKTHTFSGNPSRFRHGSKVIKVDNEWESKMSRFQQALVTTATFPWLMRYGYPLFIRK